MTERSITQSDIQFDEDNNSEHRRERKHRRKHSRKSSRRRKVSRRDDADEEEEVEPRRENYYYDDYASSGSDDSDFNHDDSYDDDEEDDDAEEEEQEEYSVSDSYGSDDEDRDPRVVEGRSRRHKRKTRRKHKHKRKGKGKGERHQRERVNNDDELFADSDEEDDRKRASRRELKRHNTGQLQQPRVRLHGRLDVASLELHNQLIEFQTGEGEYRMDWRANMASVSVVLDYRLHKDRDLGFEVQWADPAEVPLQAFKYPYVSEFRESEVPKTLEGMGLRLGDWIIAVNGQRIESQQHYEQLMERSREKNMVKLTMRFCLPPRWQVRMDEDGGLYFLHIKKKHERTKRPFSSHMHSLTRQLGVARGVMGLSPGERRELGMIASMCCCCCPISWLYAMST